MPLPEFSVKKEEHLLVHALGDYLEPLGCFSSFKELSRSLLYQSLLPQISEIVNGIEYGFYAAPPVYQKKKFFRAVAWNLERGMEYEGILHTLRHHPDLCTADLFFFPETDSGMVRSGNRNSARDLACELGMNYFFAPSYLNLCIGNSTEQHIQGKNLLGLHGNSILSRFSLENLRIVPLKNCKDKMKGEEKRIGCQKALVCEVDFPFQKITAICAHLDAHSSQRQRASQMETILSAVDSTPYPVLLGGDLNTNCYNTRHALFAFFGFWNKVFRGVDDVIENHYPYPDRTYDRFLFEILKRHGMKTDDFNEPGEGTLHYHVDDIKGNYLVREVVPEWCRKMMEKTLRRHGGQVSLKLDWFAARGLRPAGPETGAAPPHVLPNLKFGRKPLSDHDPIVVDLDIYAHSRFQ